MKVNDSCGCSSHEVVEFLILRGMKKTSSRAKALAWLNRLGLVQGACRWDLVVSFPEGQRKEMVLLQWQKIAHPKVQDAKQAWQEADLAEQELLTELKYDKEVYGWWKWGQTAQEDYWIFLLRYGGVELGKPQLGWSRDWWWKSNVTRGAFVDKLAAKRPRKFGPAAEWVGWSNDKTRSGKNWGTVIFFA